MCQNHMPRQAQLMILFSDYRSQYTRSTRVVAVACSVNKQNIEALKQRWVDAGRPQWPDWDKLMEGIVAPEHRKKVHRPS